MGPRIYPHYDSDSAIETAITSEGARGECAVYKLLRDTLPDDWVVLYNTHIRAFKDSQSDFYVVVPGKGIVNVDAKGYNYSYNYADNAFFLKEPGKDTKKEVDIIGHADKASANLSAYIKKTILGLPEFQHWGAYGKLIVFACQDIQGRETLPGGHPCVFYSEIVADPYIVKRKIEQELDRNNDKFTYFTKDRMERIIRHFIAKHPAIQRSLDFQNNDTLMRPSLTYAQNTIFRSILDNRYVHVRGGAGTGKTLIALAVAEEIARDPKKRVLYVCFNTNLAEMVSRRTKRTNIEVRNFHTLWHLIGRDLRKRDVRGNILWDATAKAIEETVPETIKENDMFDALLIDEAQDLTVDNLTCILCLGRGDLHVGIFSDENQTIFKTGARHGGSWTFPQKELFGTTHVETFDLSTNIRNTDKIFEAFRSLSGEPTMPVSIIEGVPVTGTAEDCRLLVQRLEKENHYQPHDIAVLAPNNSLLASDKSVFTDELKTWWANKKALCTTIQGFKGLEANCVVFLGANQCTDELKYEAMSRAKYELYVVG